MLTFPTLISFHLNLIKGSLQTELNNFFQHKNNQKIPTQVVTGSAFGKARKKYSETAFIELLQGVTQRFYQGKNLKRWSGLRVLAVDGSKYLLPNTKDLYNTFGGMTNQFEKCIPMALGSALYDVFQGLILDAQLAPYASSERDLALRHLEHSETTDLTLYDRGYPAFWMFSAHRDKGSFFCMRVQNNFSKETRDFVQSGDRERVVTLKANKRMAKDCEDKKVSSKDIRVRFLRVKTSKGEYILITNLIEKRQYPRASFKALYHLRWQVEEGYKKQKNWLEIENFSGESELAIRQDFHAKVLSQTLTAMMIQSAQRLIKPSIRNRDLRYKINFTQALSAMKNTLIHLLYDTIDELEMRRWLKSISKQLSAIRLGRSFTRKKKVTDRHNYHRSYKRAL